MKKQILFVHSAGAQGPHDGSGDLVAYLRNSLEAGYDVLYPKMPGLEDPEYQTWKTGFAREFSSVEDEVILVGHSLGGSVLLKYLSEETVDQPITGLFLVATPFWGGDEDWHGEFVLREDFASKLPRIPQISFYYSGDDEVVPPEHGALYREALPQATIRQLDGYGHVFQDGLPELTEDIVNLRPQE
ncbi:alpha/beta fold hydrolase [Halegenticoccus soli]|uniref:alpha/beta fold hydrolase n=1 Tax=Halegenticoccus soli TaxID=1985678 RepID=UPI000C6CDCEB|nr:alpha/beta fold hydrolase [Halegenticoccus soli]